jgi:hypothetical protein
VESKIKPQIWLIYYRTNSTKIHRAESIHSGLPYLCQSSGGVWWSSRSDIPFSTVLIKGVNRCEEFAENDDLSNRLIDNFSSRSLYQIGNEHFLISLLWRQLFRSNKIRKGHLNSFFSSRSWKVASWPSCTVLVRRKTYQTCKSSERMPIVE